MDLVGHSVDLNSARYRRIVGAVGSWRWERLLLVVVLVLGVLAMHAVPALRGAGPAKDSMSMSALAASGSAGPTVGHALPGPVQPPGDDQPGHGSGSALHDVLAVCLAILGGAALLAAAMAVFLAMPRRAGDAARVRVVPTVVAVAPRPPPAHAVRLAQLCVLRN